MSFFADAQETAERYGKYVAEFQELFRTNEVSFGSREDFFRLAPRLAHDDSFREGFAALANSVVKREDGRLTLTRMLTIIAIAMGGMEIEQVGSTGAVPVSLVVVFLAGIGGWSETEPALVGVAANSATATESAYGDNHADACGEASVVEPDEREAAELEQRLAAGPRDDLETLTTSLFGGPARVKQALTRLEMDTLQLKLHLDSIDSRMERIEPHLDDLTWRFAVQPETEHRTERNAEAQTAGEQQPVPVPPMKSWPTKEEEEPEPTWVESAPQMKPWPAEKDQDLVWEPRSARDATSSRASWPTEDSETAPLREPARAATPVREQEPMRRAVSPGARTLAYGAAPLRAVVVEDDAELPIRVPFEKYLGQEYDSENQWSRKVVAVLLVLLAVGAGGFLYRSHGWHSFNDGLQWAGVEFAKGRAVVANWASKSSVKVSSTASSNSSPTTGSERTAGAAPGTAQVQTSATPTTSAPSATPAEQAAPVAAPGQAPATVVHSNAGPVSGPVNSTENVSEHARAVKKVSRPVVTVIEGSGVAGGATAGSAQNGAIAGPVFVDSSRLSALSAPRPDYPHNALVRGITGEVVVQAIIARNGDVESAQIVSGPAGLLVASVDAVREWRYRPYLLRGKPVEVRTFVRFDYNMER